MDYSFMTCLVVMATAICLVAMATAIVSLALVPEGGLYINWRLLLSHLGKGLVYYTACVVD